MDFGLQLYTIEMIFVICKEGGSVQNDDRAD